MTDFYSVLRTSLDKVGAQNSAERQRVYGHVRSLMEKQVEQLDPPLSAQAARERMGTFDAAVDRIEDEIAHALDPTPRAGTAPAPAVIPGAALAGTAGLEAGAAGVANPDAVWDAPAIDMAWDAATEQWHDSAQEPPPVVEPPLPAGELSMRLRVALAEERGYHSGDPVAEPEPDLDDPHIDDPDYEPHMEDAEVEPVAEGFAEAANAKPSRGWRARGSGAERLTAGLARRTARTSRSDPPFEPGVRNGSAGSDRTEPPLDRGSSEPIGLLEDHSLRADDRSTPEGDPFDELYDESPRRSRRARRAAPEPALDDDDGYYDDLAPHRPVRRLFTIALVVAGIAVAGWCAYVFVPLLLPGDADPASETAADIGPGLVVFNGEDPSVFVSGPDNPVAYLTEDSGPFVRIASAATNPGARATVGPGIAEDLGGRQIVVTVNARGAPGQAAVTLRFGYLRDNEILGWRTVNITTDFQSLSIAWDIPAGGNGGEDYLLIEPGIPGDGTAVDVKSIRIEPMD